MPKKKRRSKNYKTKSEFSISEAEMLCITCKEYIPPKVRYCDMCHYNPKRKK